MFLQTKEICELAKDNFAGKIKRDKASKANVEGHINRLHYRATVILLLAFSVIITMFEYVEKISCLRASGSKIPINVVNNYCFIQTTFTLPKHFKMNFGEESILGIGTHNSKEDERKYHAYYQWVPFVLFLQAMMFYFPHLVLKNWDGDKIKKITGKYDYQKE